MRYFLLIFTLLSLGACDSPMNNRVRDNKEDAFTPRLESFTESDWQAEVRWLDGPFGNINQKNQLMVMLYKDGKLSSLPKNQTLEFYATMPSMGHPMEDAGFFEEVDTGIFINKDIRYNMPGDWLNELWIMDQDFNILDRLQWFIIF